MCKCYKIKNINKIRNRINALLLFTNHVKKKNKKKL